MGKILGFLFGGLTAIAIAGGAAGWYLMSVNKAVIVPIVKSAAVGAQTADGPYINFSGILEVSPEVAARLAAAKTVTAKVSTAQWSGGVSVGIGTTSIYENPKFPLQYALPWPKDMMQDRLKRPELSDYFVSALICIDVTPKYCGGENYPHFQGEVRLSAKIPRDSTADFIRITPPTIIVNRIENIPDNEACIRSGSEVEGTLLPTKAFLANASHATKMALVAIPHSGQVGTAFSGLKPRQPTVPEMEQLGKAGVSYQILALKGAEGASFKLKISEGFEDQQFDYYAVGCSPKEADVECASRVLPIPQLFTMRVPERQWYKLVPKGFSPPVCGSHGSILYLNEWSAPAATATLDSYQAASPPEVVEGLYY